MVLIDGVKYACASCIKGHRSSKCTHTTRPLTEIRSKGRPTSQCSHCRELRKTRSVHGKCDCAAREAEQKPKPRLLPNGLSDAMQTPEPDEPVVATTEPSGVTRLLNTCNCLRGGKCTCCSVVKRSAPKPFPGDPTPVASTSSSGCCGSSPAPDPDPASFFSEPANAAPVPVYLDVNGNIPVSTQDEAALPTPPPAFLASSPVALASPPFSASRPRSPTTAPRTRSTDALFLPKTHGTSSCFCGPTCGCVGCAVHDPYSRKRPAEGACSGGGCRCGTDKGCEDGGKRARVAEPERENGTKAGGCCGSKKAAPVQMKKSCCGKGGAGGGGAKQLDVPLVGIELPSLAWPLSSSGTSSPVYPHISSPSGASTPTETLPLPSLRTLYPALLSDLGAPPSSAGSPSSTLATHPAPLGALDPLAALETDPFLGVEPVPAPAAEVSAVRADCSAVYLAEPLDDTCGSAGGAGGAGEGCECSSGCGCRDGGAAAASSEKDEEGQRLAQLAALGAFG
ncbi:copper fist DNA-binding domain-containing protein [Rhodotorula paludigena]|uniref:copper fist DNA-binding domain-containing protein n=1 Tax=Rhodotorula paludigena TaxID=86838 RepID=UPI0031794797